MTILNFEGFDLYNDLAPNNGLRSRWRGLQDDTNNSVMIPGRFGGQALQVRNANTGGLCLSFVPQTVVTFGMAIRFPQLPLLPSATGLLSRIQLRDPYDASTFGMTFTKMGEICVSRMDGGHYTGHLLGTSDVDKLKMNTWHYLEVEFELGSSGRVSVYIDSERVLHLTNVNTQKSGVASVSWLCLTTDSGQPAIDFDDLYIKSGGAKIGERRVETVRPVADTATKQWASNGANNFGQVNELLADTSTYVESLTQGATDIYELGNMVNIPAAIDAVMVSAYARKTDAAPRSLSLIGDLGGVQDVSGNKTLSTSVNRIQHVMPAKPGGGVWTKADVDALRAGVKISI